MPRWRCVGGAFFVKYHVSGKNVVMWKIDYFHGMVVMHKKTIREYIDHNAQAASGLEEWYQIVKVADWASFMELRADLPATDLIGDDRFVFNIRGNHYRLLAAVVFKTRTILIRGIFTHAQYSKLSKSQLLTR